MKTIDLEKIKNELNIMTLAENLGLQMGRKNARCFNAAEHKNNDKNYSLAFDMRRNRFKCFACNISGSTIDLYAGVKNLPVKDAIHELWETYFNGSVAAKAAYTYREAPVKEQQDVKRLERETLIGEFSQIYEALQFFCRGLSLEAMNYLTGESRGLTKETIKKFGLFSIRDYQKCNEFLQKGWSLDVLQMSGLCGESGNLIFYKHQLIIPFYEKKQIVFLQGRRFDNAHPKYLMLSDVEVSLFNSDALKRHKKTEPVYICEGVFDAMMMDQNGKTAVAVLGVNNFKKKHAELLAKTGSEVRVLFDNDEAGQIAAAKVADLLLFEGVKAVITNVPKGYKDVTEYFVDRDRPKVALRT